jgi:DNA-binding response OmpR family regulator
MEKIKVLYVEDEIFLARVVKESLESRNFDVCLLHDGSIAQETFTRYKPDICVLDIMLPQKDGFSIARDIRSEDPDIPVIFLTAKTQTTDLKEGFEAGGNDYLKKPFSIEELIIRMNNLLYISSRLKGSTRMRSEEIIRIGRFQLHFTKQELQLENHIRKLSRRETILLEMLASQIGRPVLRTDILMKIWSDDSFYNSRSLDVYISKLRDYLSDDPGIQIVTLKGTGYRIVINNNPSQSV